jgi:hypothetical protein
MKILVGESSGSGTNDVHCNGHCLPNFNDLRFSNSDGTTLLDYWIESISGATPNQVATVWVEFDSIGTEATTFYMYYGKPDAPAYSNGDNTFIFFDHFDGTFPGSKWTGDTSYGSIANSILTYSINTNAVKRITGATTAGQSTFAIRVNGKMPAVASGKYSWIGARKSDGSHLAFIYGDDVNNQIDSKDGTTESQVASNHTTGVYKTWDIKITAGVSTIVLENGTALTGSPKTTNPPNSPSMCPDLGLYGLNLTEYLDWILLRNWNPTEPAWGSWEEEVSW